jgi:hypothetical protein
LPALFAFVWLGEWLQGRINECKHRIRLIVKTPGLVLRFEGHNEKKPVGYPASVSTGAPTGFLMQLWGVLCCLLMLSHER